MKAKRVLASVLTVTAGPAADLSEPTSVFFHWMATLPKINQPQEWAEDGWMSVRLQRY